MPRIVRIHELGGPEVLRIENQDLPQPDKGEVLIRVKALGLNRAEVLFRRGQYLENPPLPSKIGYEASGIVEAIGEGVSKCKPGDIVSLIPVRSMSKYGVYGEAAVVPEESIIKHPPSLTFIEAAASWMQYLTAYGALLGVAKMTKGDYVAIPAASSSVGLAAIQLALLEGARPIALTRTSEKKAALEKIGAEHVIITQEENISERMKDITGGKGVRIVFDPVAGNTVLELAKGMSALGILIEYGSLSGEHTPFPLILALKKGLTMRGFTLFELIQQPEMAERAIKYLSDALAKGRIKPVIAKVFPFDQIIESHQFLESNKQFGKIVVEI